VLDEWLHQGPALDLGNLNELVVALAGTGTGWRLGLAGPVWDLAPAADLVAATHGHTSRGIGAAPAAVLDALEHAGHGHVLGRPRPHAGDDGDALVDGEGLQPLAVVTEEGIVDYLLDADAAALVAHQVRVCLDQRPVGLDGGDGRLGRHVRRKRHLGGHAEAHGDDGADRHATRGRLGRRGRGPGWRLRMEDAEMK